MLIFDLVIWMLIISGLAMWALGLYGRRFVPRVSAATPYVILMFSAGAWAMLYALDLLAPTLALKVLFHNLRFVFLPFISVLEVWLVIAFVRKNEWLRPDWAAAVCVIPVVSVALALTSPLHTLFRYNFSIDTSGPIAVLQYNESPFFTLFILYSLALLVLAIIILAVESLRQGTLLHEQTLLLLAALAFPTVVNYLNVLGVSPVQGVNMTTPLLWISAILYTAALFRYRFLDIIPIARSRLIETMNAPLFLLDMDGRIVDLNPAACSLLSLPRESALGKEITTLTPSNPAFLALCRSEGATHNELTWDEGSSILFFQGSAELLRTRGGHPDGRLILLQDITNLKQIEQALRESEEKFSRAFRSSPYAITITRMDDGLILDVNDGFAQITGYSPAEVVGRTSIDLHLWANDTDRESMVNDLRANKRVYGREFPFVKKSGAILTGLFSAEIIIVQGIPYILSSINDITDRKRAEEQRESLIHELELKNAELDRFTHTISHDLKNPLFAIKGFAEILKEDLSGGDLEQVQADLARITAAADIMEHLITTLLTLSRSGRSVDTPSPVPMTEIAREAAGLLDAPIREHGVNVVIPDHLPVVNGDRQRLLQVMMNLIDNAIKFRGTQRFPKVEVGVYKKGEETIFFVRDNGRGIAPEKREEIFGLFKRLNTDIQGSGIGLTTVKRIIEAHGGRVWAKSEGPGKGTTICFTLPGKNV
ncbi:MAG TPA: histidine kinase N-terminal 7TM domain-containing protein [Methanolinea sp.]|nr:histidine kinase N-terminal 7TM domain-containing protein [Methanolinea sp.]